MLAGEDISDRNTLLKSLSILNMLNIELSYNSEILFLLFSFFSILKANDGTQGLIHDRQLLCH